MAISDECSVISEEQLIEDIAGFTHDPLGYAPLCVPVGEEGTENWHMPPVHVSGGLMRSGIRDHLQNPETRYQPLMLARASGHGVVNRIHLNVIQLGGMSAARIVSRGDRQHRQPAARAKVPAGNHQMVESGYHEEWFTCTATAMYSNDQATTSAGELTQPWSEHSTEAFAGLHNERKRIIVVFDEASNVRIWCGKLLKVR